MRREKDITFHIKNKENQALKIKAIFYCIKNYLIKAGEILATIS